MSILPLALLLLVFPFAVECADICEADSFHSDCFVLRLLNEGCKGKELSDLKCALKIRTEIRRWLRKQKTMRILVVGKLNIGKTTLVKGLLNSSYGIPKEQHTTKVTQYQHAQDYVNLIFYDTPGLVKSNDNAIHGIKEPNLLIFALKMDDKTLQEEDKGAIESVTKAYGWRVWKNAMFVLTYANRVVKLGTAPRENKVHFNGVIYDYKIEITNKLLELQVQEYFANHIPVVPVGLASEPFIESDGRKIYGRKISWIEEFWTTLFESLEISKQDPPPEPEKKDTSLISEEGDEEGDEETANPDTEG